HDAADLDLIAEELPDAAVVSGLEARDRRLAGAPAQAPSVGKLTAAAGMERAALEHDRTRPRVDHARLERQEIGLVVAEIARHGRSASECHAILDRAHEVAVLGARRALDLFPFAVRPALRPCRLLRRLL